MSTQTDDTQIVYTDRYGGQAPSWLRGCFGACAAMGWVPVQHDEADPALLALWRDAEAKEPADDGWHFVRCPSCHGTGRVSWLRTVLRLPRWVVKGVRFVWSMGVVRNKECRPAPWTWWHAFRVTVAIAFLVDLGLWRP